MQDKRIERIIHKDKFEEAKKNKPKRAKGALALKKNDKDPGDSKKKSKGFQKKKDSLLGGFETCKKSDPMPNTDPDSAQDLVPVLQIHKDGVFLIANEPGKKIFDKVYQFVDINYTLGEDWAKELSLNAYTRLLGILDQPFKIILTQKHYDPKMITNNILFQQLDTEEGQDSMQEDLVIKDINNIISDRLEQGSGGLDKIRYLVLTQAIAEDDIDIAYTRAQAAFSAQEVQLINEFKSLGSNLKILNGVERLEALKTAYRFGSNTKLAADWDEIESLGNDWKDLIAPENFTIQQEYIAQENSFIEVLYLSHIGLRVDDNFLTSLLAATKQQTCVTLSCTPIPRRVAEQKLFNINSGIQMAIAKQQQRNNQSGAYSTNISVEKRNQSAKIEEYLNAMQNNDERFLYMGVTLVITAPTLEELTAQRETIKTVALAKNCEFEIQKLWQLEGFSTALPVGGRYTDTMRAILTSSWGAFFPFNMKDRMDSDGLVYGVNTMTRNIIMGNRKSLPNGNGFVFGLTGSGKSFFVKNEIIQAMKRYPTDKFIIIDPQNEYKGLAQVIGGQNIEFSPMSPARINMLEIPPGSNDSDIELLKSTKADVMAGMIEQVINVRGLRPDEVSIIGRVVRTLYDGFKPIYHATGLSPTLLEFYDILSAQPDEAAQEMTLYLEEYVKGVSNLFSAPTNVVLDNRLVVYGIRDLGSTMFNVAILAMIEGINNQISTNAKNGYATWVYLDEAHILLEKEYSRKSLRRLWMVTRKYGGVPTAITQNLTDTFETKEVQDMLNNSDFKVVFRQMGTNNELAQRLLGFSTAEAAELTKATTGEGLIVFEHTTLPFNNMVDSRKYPTIYNLLSTNFHEQNQHPDPGNKKNEKK